MRRLALFVLLPVLGACASASVTLLPGEPGSQVGAVAVLDPSTGAERGTLSVANTRTGLGGRVTARRADPKLYAALTAAIPAPAAHYTLYFFEGTTKLTPASEPELKKVFAELAKRPGAEVQITGHTDTVGQMADNDRLSLDRAREVREVLIAQGLNPTISRAVGRGERELLIATPDNTPEPRNRRVEIIVR